MDNRKIILSLYVAASAIVWMYGRAILQYVYFNFYQVRRLMMGLDVLRDAIPLVLGIATFLFLFKNKKVNEFLDESATEIRKVTWPSRPDVVKSTTVVIVCVIIASSVLASFDVVWGKIMGVLLS